MLQQDLFPIDTTPQFEPTIDPGTIWSVQRLDALAGLRALPSASVDLIVTDPAYESLEKHRAVGTTTRLKKSKASSNAWFPIFPNVRFPEFFAECYRVLKPNTHMYVLCDQETMFAIKPMGEEAGFKFWKPIVWNKGRIALGYHYRCQYELILFFEKGKRKLNDLSIPDVLTVPPVRGQYPTQKPVELLRTLIRNSSAADDLVLDPFCGSSSTGEAAIHAERRFLGFDVLADAIRVSGDRLAVL